MKLTTSNYLAWQAQVLPIIHGYNLSKFIESSPPSSITSTTGQFEVNPEYLQWRRQDQLFLGWLRSSLTDSMQAQVVSASTTLELWITLQKQCASTSSSRRLELRRQIQACQKGNSSCTEYLNNLRQIADELAFVGAPISDEELVLQAIQGLGTDYNPVVVAINVAAHHNPFFFSNLHGLLVSHESLLKSQLSVTVPSAFYTSNGNLPPPNAFYTNNTSKNNNYNNNYKPRLNAPYYNNNSPPLLPNPVSATNRSPLRPNTATIPQISNPTHVSRISCQICFKLGHTGKLCYRRYNPDPEWQPNPRFQAYNAQIISHAQPTSQATVSNPPTTDMSNSSWLLDSGANNHVTTDLNNLSSFFEYTGPDKLFTGNGKGLTITHIGSCVLTVSDLSIKLTNMLYVPKFSTNLISISKLIHDNPNISINFSSSF
jgi:gag-polypeptide of LTR copia-type